MILLQLALWVVAAPEPAIPTRLPPNEEALVDVTTLDPRWRLRLPYATEDNFFQKKVYQTPRCFLRKSVAAKMQRAQAWLDQKHPGLVLVFKDCYRPDRVQHVMWDAVKGTKKSAYVMNPGTKQGSIHSYGAAVDITLGSKDQDELDMGTPHDFLGELAEPRHEAEMLTQGKLTQAQVENRHLLRDAMRTGGMRSIPNEWWHFDDDRADAVMKKFRRLDVPLEEL
ncbi:MAG: M15 family metallopeptidase [Myxococcota bacterium]